MAKTGRKYPGSSLCTGESLLVTVLIFSSSIYIISFRLSIFSLCDIQQDCFWSTVATEVFIMRAFPTCCNQSMLLIGIQIQVRNKESFVPLSSKVFAISFSGFRISTTAYRPSRKTKQAPQHTISLFQTLKRYKLYSTEVFFWGYLIAFH